MYRVSLFVVAVLALLEVPVVVQGSPMQTNPLTPLGDVVLLSPVHPAYGAEIRTESRIAPELPTATIQDLLGEMISLNGGMTDAGSVVAAGETATVENTTTPATIVDTTAITPATVPNTTFPTSLNATTNSTHRRTGEAREMTVKSDLDRLESHLKSVERNFNKLPIKGEASTTPWPGSYWPVFEDGINFQWQKNQPSPAEKYAKAFGLNPKDFELAVSNFNGILSMKTRRSCKSEGDCGSLNDGSTCAKRPGEQSGFCIPKWFGICHAWAPAAILEAEPKCPVTVNKVKFQPFDIKALLTEIYDGVGVETVFTGARYNGNDKEGQNTDNYGRYKDATRRDLGPGFFHIASANLLGARKQSFILDVSSAADVWNQPLKSYEVIQKREMKPDAAASEFFKTKKYPFNPVVQKIMYVKNRFKWMLESKEDGPLVATNRADRYVQTMDYEYLLELDNAGNILGGEWVGKSKTDHPDFLWFATGKPPSNSVSRVGISYEKVSDMLKASIKANC